MTRSHPTAFRRKASTDRPMPGRSFGLAPELAQKARGRVKWMAFAQLFMCSSSVSAARSLFTPWAIWNTPMEQMLQHAKDDPAPPSTRSEHDIPEALERVILSCLAKDPADRPASAQDLASQQKDCPVKEPWTPERAHRWWDVHRPADQGSPQT